MGFSNTLWVLSSLAGSVVAAGTIIPPALSSGFSAANSLSLEVSFPGQQIQGQNSRFNGVTDGTTLTRTEASSAPVFALGDESGVNTRIQFLAMMVDSTDANNLVLHFAQDQFKADGTQTGISSEAKPLVDYQAPGSLGETGTRQYSFLLFQQSAAVKGSAKAGPFDLNQFMSANGLKPAKAGVGINVKLDGGAGGGAGGGAPATSATVGFTSAVSTPAASIPALSTPSLTRATLTALPTPVAPLPSASLTSLLTSVLSNVGPTQIPAPTVPISTPASAPSATAVVPPAVSSESGPAASRISSAIASGVSTTAAAASTTAVQAGSVNVKAWSTGAMGLLMVAVIGLTSI